MDDESDVHFTDNEQASDKVKMHLAGTADSVAVTMDEQEQDSGADTVGANGTFDETVQSSDPTATAPSSGGAATSPAAATTDHETGQGTGSRLGQQQRNGEAA